MNILDLLSNLIILLKTYALLFLFLLILENKNIPFRLLATEDHLRRCLASGSLEAECEIGIWMHMIC